MRLLLLLLLLVPSIAFGATEDFTTFTEINEFATATISITASQVTADTVRRDRQVSIYKDYGSGNFGEFDHDIQCKVDAFNNTFSRVSCWAMGNAIPYENTLDTNNYGFAVSGNCGSSCGSSTLQFKEFTGNTNDSTSMSAGTDYYLTIKRTDVALTCEVYSDPSRETLTTTLSVTYDGTTYSHLGVVNSRDTSGTENLDMTVDDLEFQTVSEATRNRLIIIQ